MKTLLQVNYRANCDLLTPRAITLIFGLCRVISKAKDWMETVFLSSVPLLRGFFLYKLFSRFVAVEVCAWRSDWFMRWPAS